MQVHVNIEDLKEIAGCISSIDIAQALSTEPLPQSFKDEIRALVASAHALVEKMAGDLSTSIYPQD